MLEGVLGSMNFAVCGRPFVCREDCLPAAAVAHQFPSAAERASTVPDVAGRGNVGASGEVTARAGPQGGRTKRLAYGGDHRFAIGQYGIKRGARGYEAGKKVKGRKGHIEPDTQGNLLAVMVHLVGVQNCVAARAVLMRLFCLFGTTPCQQRL